MYLVMYGHTSGHQTQGLVRGRQELTEPHLQLWEPILYYSLVAMVSQWLIQATVEMNIGRQLGKISRADDLTWTGKSIIGHLSSTGLINVGKSVSRW